ncbi:MAG: ABC-F family ATP-binding cassette domain-containing protein [Candidatus Cloacimonetes bacterium]|nr:ABC-F family ATP-binding cassette domain-containing protein [Candidatus Cloacimonadota bacterium]
MSLVQVIDASLEFGGNYILKNIDCTLEHNSRIGLIGPNGSGKSTLIKLMLGQLHPVSGEVIRAKKCHIAYLAQNFALDPLQTLYTHVSSARSDIQSLHRQIMHLSEELQHRHEPETEEKLKLALDRFQNLGGDEYENELKFVCNSLGFTEAEYNKPAGLFSGGEQTRICLAAILLTPFDLLILDEPTNHLDIAMIAWLERYLLQLGKPYLVVSHDRNFLDNTVSSIYSLRDGKLSITKGNYSSYAEADAIARKAQERQFERQQKFINETEDFIARNIAGQKTNMAKSRLKMLSRMEIVQKPKQEKQIRLNIQSQGRSGNDVFSLEDMEFGIGEEKVLATQVNLKAHYKDRICILGTNGCGKTTLLKAMLGERPILSGTLKIGASLEIAYYDQHQVSLDDSLTVMDTLWQLVPEATRGYVLGWLARFGFRGDDVDKYVSVLSGGEKSRLNLCVLIHSRPNLLIMDEPTNHLDIAMSDELLKALDDYTGTIIFVSHDRWFIRELATKYWIFNQMIQEGRYLPTITEKTDSLDEAIALAFNKPELPKEAPKPREKKKKINPWYLEQIQQQIDAQHAIIAAEQDELHSIHKLLALSDTYASAEKVFELQARMKQLEDEINAHHAQITDLETQYLELSYED